MKFGRYKYNARKEIRIYPTYYAQTFYLEISTIRHEKLHH